jgi:hypothetical protein
MTMSLPSLNVADDVVLLSDSPQQLQRMLDAVSLYAERCPNRPVVAGTHNSAAERDAGSHA